jgi:hypothetical protein
MRSLGHRLRCLPESRSIRTHILLPREPDGLTNYNLSDCILRRCPRKRIACTLAYVPKLIYLQVNSKKVAYFFIFAFNGAKKAEATRKSDNCP